MEKIGFYPLTIILSYLAEKDGVLLLSTKRKFVSQVLPIFLCCPSEEPKVNQLRCNCNSEKDEKDASSQHPKRKRNRYHFKVSPVQDPTTLLDRLNTRRWYKRRRHLLLHGRSSATSTSDTTISTTNNRTISEIANLEWMQQQVVAPSQLHWTYPPELELLRFKTVLSTLNQNEKSSFQYLYQPANTSSPHPKTILLVSYPRSGNTLLRTLLERTTGYVTGSDTRPDRSLSRALAEQHNLIGEGIVAANRVLYVKTHYPERLGHQIFQGHAAILVVRNPYDAIDSYWNMNATKSHTKSLTPEMYQQYWKMWYGLVQNEIQVWNKFLEYWLNDECPIPVLVIRFEDLIGNPSLVLQRILEFTIRQNSNKTQQEKEANMVQLSEYWMSRIQHCCNTSGNTEKLGSYQPRSATSGVSSIGKSLRTDHYSNEMLDYMHHVCTMKYPTNYLRHFGYDIPIQNFPNNFIHPHSNNRDDSQGTVPALITENRAAKSNDCSTALVRVNDGTPIRPVDCQYGRRLQQWRHSVTDNDRNPLATVEKQ